MSNKIDIKLNDAIMDQENIEKLADKINEVIDEVPEVNPEGEATESLTKLKVGDTIYGVSGGGGISVIVFESLSVFLTYLTTNNIDFVGAIISETNQGLFTDCANINNLGDIQFASSTGYTNLSDFDVIDSIEFIPTINIAHILVEVNK